MPPKKVALFYKRLLGPGGAERQFLEEYKYLRHEGIPVQVLTFEVQNEALFGMRIPELEIISTHNPISALWYLRQHLKKFKPDLISVHSGHIDIYLATQGLGIPYIFHHNSPVLLHSGSEPVIVYSLLHRKSFQRILDANPWVQKDIRRVRKFTIKERLLLELRAFLNLLAIRAAKQIIVLSEQTAWEIKQMYGREAVCIRGALDPQVLSYIPVQNPKKRLDLEGHKVILSVSRLSFEKRLGLLIRAFDRVAEEAPDVILLIGGCGPEEQNLKAFASTCAHGDRIRFVGFIKEEELWDYYAACDVFASPAWADFDIAPYEALALGKKVVWSTEMETEDRLLASGLIIQANPAVADFSQALKTALMREVNGRPDLAEYTWLHKFEKVYQLVTH